MTQRRALADALDALITCRTVATVLPGAVVRGPLQRRTRGPVDLAILGDRPAPAALHPRAILHRSEEPLPSLDLADDSAVWRPGLSLGLAKPKGPETETGVLILSQRPAVANYLLADARSRDIPVVAAIAVGQHRPQLWREILLAALEHPRVKIVLLALQRRVDIDDLATCARQATSTPVLLHVSADALVLRSASLGAMPTAARLDVLAPALGIATFPTPAQCLEGAGHLLRGLRRRTGDILPIVSDAHEIPILERQLDLAGLRVARHNNALRDAGLRLEGAFVIAPTRQHLLSRALRRARPLAVDALVCAGQVPRALGVAPPQLVIGPSCPAPPARPIDETALAALGCLLRARPPRLAPSTQPLGELALPSRTVLAEHVAKDLARRHGIAIIPEHRVSSASAAAKAAGELEGPLSVRASGPGLSLSGLDDELRDLLHRRDLNSTAATRQAFHDVLFACTERLPDEPIDDIVVAETPAQGASLDCLLVFPDDLPLARLALNRDPRCQDAKVAWLRFPAHQDERAAFARDLLSQRAVPSATPSPRHPEGPIRAELRRLLEQLERLALDVASSLRWLHLGPIRLPDDGSPALVLIARGERR